MQGISGYVAVYDLLTGSRLGRLDLKSIPVEMSFAPDGSVLVVVVQDWILFSISLSSWKSRVLVPKRTKMDKPLESCLLAVAPVGGKGMGPGGLTLCAASVGAMAFEPTATC